MLGELLPAALRRAISPYDQEEQGYSPHASEPNAKKPEDVRPLTVAITDVKALIPRHDKLLVFRALTGIDTVPALTRAGHSIRTAPNLGIYTRVVRAEQFAGQKYKVISLLVNACLGVQILVAAILTSLGAADGPHSAVTAFGAINTIIAGILTYVKGSGLPDKFKYDKDEWKRVREYIEQREREFCVVDCDLDVQEEIHVVEEMYKRVKANLEASKNRASAASNSNNKPAAVSTMGQSTMGQSTMGQSTYGPESSVDMYQHHHHPRNEMTSPPSAHARTSIRPESATTVPMPEKLDH